VEPGLRPTPVGLAVPGFRVPGVADLQPGMRIQAATRTLVRTGFSDIGWLNRQDQIPVGNACFT
jgi:hypothetical protein